MVMKSAEPDERLAHLAFQLLMAVRGLRTERHERFEHAFTIHQPMQQHR
jgi:hypothetical protein